MSMNKQEVIIKAGAGQGKTYQICEKALFLTATTKKLSIIGLPTKLLVSEVCLQIEEIRKREIAKNNILNLNKISILKHTFDEKLTTADLLDSFLKGECVIVTVFAYIKKFDSYGNVSSFNSFLYIFGPIVNLFIDEGDQLLKNIKERYNIVNSIVNLKDHSGLPYNKMFYYDWDESKPNDDLIKLVQLPYKTIKNSYGFMEMKQNFNNFINKEEYFIVPKYSDICNNNIIITKKGKKALNLNVDEIVIKNKNYETNTQKVMELEIPYNAFEKCYLHNYNNLIYNCISLIIREIYSKSNFRKFAQLRQEIDKLKRSEEEYKYENVLDHIFNYVFVTNILDKIYFGEDVKNKLKTSVESHFKIYKLKCYETNSLLSQIVYDSANEAFFYKLLSSTTVYLNYYFPQIIEAEVEMTYQKGNYNFFKIKIISFDKKKTNSEEDFINAAFSLKKNKNIIKIINDKVKKNRTSNQSSTLLDVLENPQNSDNSQLGESEIETAKGDVIMANNENKKNNSKIINEIKNLCEKDEFVYKGPITLKINLPSHLYPFGCDLFMVTDQSLQLLTNVNNYIITSATFNSKILNFHTEQNEKYGKLLNFNIDSKIL